MPHVILQGPLEVEDIWLSFRTTEFAEKGNHFKAEEAYLSNDKKVLLVRSLVSERGYARTVLVRFTQQTDGVHMGIDKIGSPEKTDGVKRLLGLYTAMILTMEPRVSVAATNIREFLGEPQL